MTQTTTKPTMKQIWITMALTAILLFSAGFALMEGLNPQVVNLATQQQLTQLSQILNESTSQIEAQLQTNLDAVFYAMGKPCTYLISVLNGSTPVYCMQDGGNASLTYFSTVAQTTINFAIANTTIINPTGGTDFLRAGFYNLTGGLLVTQSGVVLNGEGEGTELYEAPASNLATMINMSGVGMYFDTVENMFLYGNKEGQTSGGQGIYINVTYTGVDCHIRIENVFINDTFTDGIYIEPTGDSAREVELTRDAVYNTGRYGYYFGGSSSDHKVLACVAGNTGQDGFYVSASNSQFDECKAFGAGIGGHYASEFYGCGWVFSSAYRLQVTNCQAQDCQADGFLIYATYNDLYIGLQGDTNSKNNTGTYAGIKLDQANTSNDTIVGCTTFNRNPFTQGYGIWLTSTPSNNTIVGCNANFNTVYGIWTQSAVGFNNIHSDLNESAWIT